MMLARLYVSCYVSFAVSGVVGRGYELVGDREMWSKMFLSSEPELVWSEGLEWPEGPTWTSRGLMFSDTITGRMYLWDEATLSPKVIKESAGGCPKLPPVVDETYECMEDAAEPGANGMSKERTYVKNAKPSKRVTVCQHGARRPGTSASTARGASTARVAAGGVVSGVITSGLDERPVLGLSAFFEALVWLAWRGGGGGTRERAGAAKAAKELAPSLRRLLASGLLP